MSSPTNIIEIKGLTKKFPGVLALNDVDLDIRRGEVHVLVGENGAGKSSLIKVLCGIYFPDEGEVIFEGELYAPRNTHEAIQSGIRVVYQEFNLLPYLSIAENIYFEKLPQRAGMVDYATLYRNTEKSLKRIGLDVSPKLPVELLGVAQTQLIEIAKALSGESKVLILDEPTATLTPPEISRLFEIIHQLKDDGVTIIYISHRLQEISEIGDRISVLRNGEMVGTRSVAEVSIPEIVKMMVGKEMGEEYLFEADVELGDELFSVQNLSRRNSPYEVSFTVREGELLGISGLVGSGRTETMRTVFGADPKTGGQLFLRGEEISIHSPKDAVRHGICLLTEDRKQQGLILDMPCYMNITLTDLAQVSRRGVLRGRKELADADRMIDELAIKVPSAKQFVRNLSGGNQQKVVLAKWLYRDADVLIFDEPTRGIDVGAKYEIYLLLWQLARMGKAIIIISSDLPELLGICHRLLVFSDGKVTGNLSRDNFDQEEILSLAYQEYI